MRKTILIHRSKLSTRTAFLTIQCFCSSAPIKWAAEYTGLSERTVRRYYLHLRDIIASPAFNAWHTHAVINPASPDKRTLFEQGSYYFKDCYFNETCKRNFDLGNRKRRLCRGCSIRRVIVNTPENIKIVEARILADDLAKNFYTQLGIREKKGPDPFRTMYLQSLHLEVVGRIRTSSRRTAQGLIDIDERTEKSGGLLMYQIVLALITRARETNTEDNEPG